VKGGGGGGGKDGRIQTLWGRGLVSKSLWGGVGVGGNLKARVFWGWVGRASKRVVWRGKNSGGEMGVGRTDLAGN